MCEITHYIFCVKVSNAAKTPPNDRHDRCELHFQLLDAHRQGDPRALGQLRDHDRRKTLSSASLYLFLTTGNLGCARRARTDRVHYGQAHSDGTCLVDKTNCIVDKQLGNDPALCLSVISCSSQIIENDGLTFYLTGFISAVMELIKMPMDRKSMGAGSHEFVEFIVYTVGGRVVT